MAATTATETATVLAADFSDCCSPAEAELPPVSLDPIPIQGSSQSQDKRGKELEVMPPLRRRTIKTSDLQRMQFEVLREQKRKLVLQCEHLELMNKKLRRELQE
ncbi:uncharacterized protein LOC110449415 [Mizuhopecten yessoensis]|uniref:Uncharacterized protein n=1 Tax=Mizuhopecten yessoensis TaxID=6573 RepID=A0A210QRF1_MIZYE|nr:uncharacterized protein LOC110449415 [Mizuhopecten yessoensis]OWF51258.1 hypothetical protein KP79_PYT00742 [Mizuhopecten yessoensis]